MRMLLIVAGVVAVLYVIYRSYRSAKRDTGLEPLIRNGAVILDVRTETEYRGGHLDGSVNIPLSRLHDEPIALDKSKPVITYCSHGLRSVKAAALLKEHGFEHVYNGGAMADLEQTIRKAR